MKFAFTVTVALVGQVFDAEGVKRGHDPDLDTVVPLGPNASEPY